MYVFVRIVKMNKKIMRVIDLIYSNEKIVFFFEIFFFLKGMGIEKLY